MAFRKLRQHISRYHKMRKHKEENLPQWKQRWLDFNMRHLWWLERFVDIMIPWLVLLLLFIILGEFSSDLNFFHWNWPELVSEFFEVYEFEVFLLDQIIILFFVIDLYFNFFKKATLWSFIKTSFLDIIAVAPVGLILRISEVSEAQSILHLTSEVEKEAARVVKETEVAERLAKAAEESERLAKLSKAAKSTRFARFLQRIPRLVRLYRIEDFVKKKKHKKKGKAKLK